MPAFAAVTTTDPGCGEMALIASSSASCGAVRDPDAAAGSEERRQLRLKRCVLAPVDVPARLEHPLGRGPQLRALRRVAPPEIVHRHRGPEALAGRHRAGSLRVPIPLDGTRRDPAFLDRYDPLLAPRACYHTGSMDASYELVCAPAPAPLADELDARAARRS